MGSEDLPELSPAAEAFARFLSQREDGEGADFEAFCEQHSELADELRRIFAGWQRTVGVLGPGPDASLGERITAMFGEATDPAISLDASPTDGEAQRPGLDRATELEQPRAGRYTERGEVARGGMGSILEVWDRDLRRTLAMKVLLAASPDRSPGLGADPRAVSRFLEEAQITGQLEHPGIVPIYELGLDAAGRIYFTMPLVRGRDLKQIFEVVRRGDKEWTQTRVLSVLLRVCEALAFAHAKGVIHRDLKPANIMVGPYGETYVMDWGLARVLGDASSGGAADPGLAADLHEAEGEGATPIETARTAIAAATPKSPLMTADGDVVGTPAYMAPEQARGQHDLVGPRADVYSIGAMLYELLSGAMPYAHPHGRNSSHAVLTRVLSGPPASIHELAPDVPAELAAICEKAMAYEARERYPDVRDLGDELRAYLEGRVVRSYETGAVAELRKWVRRNRPLAASIAVAMLAVVLGLAGIGFVEAGRRSDAESANAALRVAKAEADENARVADERAARVLRLSDVKRLQQLQERADTLWPADPDKADAYRSWLEEARSLVSRLDVEHRPTLESMQAETSSVEDAWEYETLSELVADLDEFRAAEGGLLEEIAARLEFSTTVEEKSLTGSVAKRRWAEAIESIAQDPVYGGLRVEPILGLLPIGRDRQSSLWEFAHLQTGSPPLRDDATGELRPVADCGVVLVLIPGGSFLMGSQTEDPNAPNYLPSSTSAERPVHTVELDAFLLSKYELTQAQWMRLTGENPSLYWAPEYFPRESDDLRSMHPVEQVSWAACEEVLGRVHLGLPTEAQWEYATRAGSTTPWWTGAEPASLQGAVNIADNTTAQIQVSLPEHSLEIDDGYAQHAPVHYYEPNPFGLHNVHGNVWEWCADGFAAKAYELPVRAGDGMRMDVNRDHRVLRGGSFANPYSDTRSSVKAGAPPDAVSNAIGVRPSRRLP